MQTSAQVFLALAVIYFGSVVLPLELAADAVGWTSQAVVISGAVATFSVLRQNQQSPLQAAGVLTCALLIAAAAAASVVDCGRREQCQASLPKHALVFSTGFLSGAAAYLGYLMGSAAGLPMWAVLTLAVVTAPVVAINVMPWVADKIAGVHADRPE